MRFDTRSKKDILIYSKLDEKNYNTDFSKTSIIKAFLNDVFFIKKSKDNFSIVNMINFEYSNFYNSEDLSRYTNRYYYVQIKFYDDNDNDKKLYYELENLNLVGTTKPNFIKNVLLFYFLDSPKEIINQKKDTDNENNIDNTTKRVGMLQSLASFSS